ncbi:TM2 domain-containing protein, partial [Pseudomonadales bacterium]|nr:TM2 domain-containing protein [Pseudomonadales bacterium]
LSDAGKRDFYASVKKRVKDPDTYATLNWFFIAGLHHFYLGKWLNGCIDLAAFVIGIVLIVAKHPGAGITVILIVSIAEFWALFRSQIIIQDWNNKIYIDELRKHR